MREYANDGDLIKILDEEFPELEVEIPVLYPGNGMNVNELRKSIRAIKNNGYVEDAIRIINHGLKPVKSITYPVAFPEDGRNLDFNVEWVLGTNVYIGWIISEKPGRKTYHVRLYNMWHKRGGIKEVKHQWDLREIGFLLT